MKRFLYPGHKLFFKQVLLPAILFLSMFFLPCKAQVCNGVLGQPVLNIDFGAGPDRGNPLPATETDYLYTATNAIINRQYTITNNSGGFYSQWFNTTDHTGNENGYMMVMNCDLPGDKIYSKQISGLCPNTTFQLSAWVLNLLNSDYFKGVDVNLTFSAETSAGQVLKILNTGNISAQNTPDWKNVSLFFTTPVAQTDIVIKIINNAEGGDGNDLALDDISIRPCQPDIHASFTAQNSAKNLMLCQGNTADFKLETNVVAAHQNPDYQWQINANDGFGWKGITGATSTSLALNFKTASPGLYQYRLYSIQQENKDIDCCQVFSDTASVQIDAQPVPAASGNTPLCAGESLYLNVAGGVSYQWTGPAGFTSTLQNPVIANISSAQAGLYRVTLTSAAGCVATDVVQVNLNPATNFSAGAAVTICAGSSTVLAASGGVTYQWYPAAGLSDPAVANPVASPASSTVYRVKITNQYGCVQVDSVSVKIARPPVADAGPDKRTAAGKSVRLSGKIIGENYTYHWLPETYLSDANALEPIVTPRENITYTLHAVSTLDCGETVDSVRVEIESELLVPNTFSPNADGINDTWNIAALDAYPESIIEVYNRYGKEIFRTIGMNNPWNGTYNGQPLPIGTYFYKISNKTQILKSGWVLLVR